MREHDMALFTPQEEAQENNYAPPKVIYLGGMKAYLQREYIRRVRSM